MASNAARTSARVSSRATVTSPAAARLLVPNGRRGEILLSVPQQEPGHQEKPNDAEESSAGRCGNRARNRELPYTRNLNRARSKVKTHDGEQGEDEKASSDQKGNRSSKCEVFHLILNFLGLARQMGRRARCMSGNVCSLRTTTSYPRDISAKHGLLSCQAESVGSRR